MANTIKITLSCERPATQADVDEQDAWLKAHPGTSCIPTELGDMIDVEEEHELPAEWVICNRCRGNGTHVNPSIDSHGITQEEFDEDPDFEEAYFDGSYDIACEERCRDGKVLVIARERLTPAQKQLVDRYDEVQADNASDAAADRHTRFMENGGRY